MSDLPTLERPRRTAPPLSAPGRLGAVTLVLGAVVLAVTFALNPGPDAVHVTDPGWVPGHLLTSVAYVLLLLGVPALGRRELGWPGALGVAGLMAHFAVSSGSQLYYARIVPVLAGTPAVHDGLGPQGRLANLYGGWRDAFDLVTAVALVALAYGCWRAAPTLRALAVLLVLAALGEVFVTPVALLAFVVAFGWSGLRLLLTGDLAQPLRGPRGTASDPVEGAVTLPE